jgi:hypothetical protein
VDEVDADADAESDAHSDSEMEEHSDEEGPSRTYTHDDLRREIQEKRDRGEDLIYAEDLQDAEDFFNHHMPSSDAPMPGDYDHIEEVPVVKRRGVHGQGKDPNVVRAFSSISQCVLNKNTSISLSRDEDTT